MMLKNIKRSIIVVFIFIFISFFATVAIIAIIAIFGLSIDGPVVLSNQEILEAINQEAENYGIIFEELQEPIHLKDAVLRFDTGFLERTAYTEIYVPDTSALEDFNPQFYCNEKNIAILIDDSWWINGNGILNVFHSADVSPALKKKYILYAKSMPSEIEVLDILKNAGYSDEEISRDAGDICYRIVNNNYTEDAMYEYLKPYRMQAQTLVNIIYKLSDSVPFKWGYEYPYDATLFIAIYLHMKDSESPFLSVDAFTSDNEIDGIIYEAVEMTQELTPRYGIDTSGIRRSSRAEEVMPSGVTPSTILIVTHPMNNARAATALAELRLNFAYLLEAGLG